MRGGLLHVAQRHSGIESGGDEGVSQRVRRRLDILVNNAANFAGPVKPGGFWNNPWSWPT